MGNYGFLVGSGGNQGFLVGYGGNYRFLVRSGGNHQWFEEVRCGRTTPSCGNQVFCKAENAGLLAYAHTVAYITSKPRFRSQTPPTSGKRDQGPLISHGGR